MKKMSQALLANIVKTKRSENNLTQEDLSAKTGINRVMIGKIENMSYLPSITQIEQLSEVLKFDITEILVDRKPAFYSAFRGENKSQMDQCGIDYLQKMMLIAKQQLLLREMMDKHE